MKKFSKALMIVSAVLLVFAVLVGALLVIFTDKDWVYEEYNRIGIEAQTGWDSDYCWRVLTAMMDYSIGSRSTLNNILLENARTAEPEQANAPRFFNESELAHMADVRKLATSVLKLGLASLIFGFVLFSAGLLLGRKSALRTFAISVLIAIAVLVVIIAALGIWMVIDFDSFWTVFHIVFLDLESSTFDPAVSNMIRICPGELFFDFIKHFALIAGIAFVLIILACAAWLIVLKKRFKDDLSLSSAIYILLGSFIVCCCAATLFENRIVFSILSLAAIIVLLIFRYIDTQ